MCVIPNNDQIFYTSFGNNEWILTKINHKYFNIWKNALTNNIVWKLVSFRQWKSNFFDQILKNIMNCWVWNGMDNFFFKISCSISLIYSVVAWWGFPFDGQWGRNSFLMAPYGNDALNFNDGRNDLQCLGLLSQTNPNLFSGYYYDYT